jgi:YHS domain-containing protein
MVIDPVCKMKVDEKTAKFKSEYQEKYLKKIEEDRPIKHGCC